MSNTSRLLELPAELRNRIFELVVVKPQPIRTACCKPCIKDQNSWADERLLPQQPAITRANRQLRAEVLPIFYGLNTFRIPHNILREKVSLKEWWESFANEASVKHVNNIIYGFLPPQLGSWSGVGGVSSRVIEMELRGTGVEEIRCKIRGLPESICTCAVESSLQVSAARGIGHTLRLLHDCVEPYLMKGICRSTNADIIIEMIRSQHRSLQCQDCSKQSPDKSVVEWLDREARREKTEKDADELLGQPRTIGVRDLEMRRAWPALQQLYPWA
ncbi:hypothetical protein LTR27_008019 [Elasticomyces elasticus]|nr:hypothetical protein LTR27_008019 [Elasticomyces elasticus]